jgi:hypothetical protein
MAVPAQVFAQSGKYEVKGVVVDTTGTPVIGASVFEIGTNNGVTTDVNGQYELKVNSAESIVEISFIGYKTLTLVASSSQLQNVVLEEDFEEDPSHYLNGCCVLIHDYTKQLSQTIIPRCEVNDPLLDVMSNCIPYLNTALMNSTGVSGIKVQNQDEAAQVDLASRSLQNAALTGQKWIPMKGTVDFQDLSGSNVAKGEEYLLAMQSLDNLRLSLYGLENGGLFQKKSHMLEAEQEMNSGNQSLILKDGLDIRQRFCNIVNSVWGIGIWCETAEEVLNVDLDGDGLVAGDNDQETIGSGEGGNENVGG